MTLTDFLTNYNSAATFCIWLYNRQTEEERKLRTVTDANHRGFNRWDAPYLTNFVELYLAGLIPEHNKNYQHNILSRKLAKYKKQYEAFCIISISRTQNQSEEREESFVPVPAQATLF